MPNSVPMSPLSASSTLAAHRGSNYSDSDREINEEYEEEMALKNWAAMQVKNITKIIANTHLKIHYFYLRI
jgi:hypothetical protein